jgi:hypothetical protein
MNKSTKLINFLIVQSARMLMVVAVLGSQSLAGRVDVGVENAASSFDNRQHQHDTLILKGPRICHV